MKKFFLFFIIFKTFLTKELTILYTSNFYNNYNSIKLKDKTVGGVSGIKSKMNELEIKYPNFLKIYLGDKHKIQDSQELENHMKIIDKFKFDILSVDINSAKNNDRNLPFTSSNIFEIDENFNTKFEAYKNFYIDNNKISVISVSDVSFEKAIKFDEDARDIKIKNPIIEAKRTLELLKRNFNPHLIIFLSTFNSKEFIKILQENKNIILILKSSQEINNLKGLENKYIIGKNLKENEIGLIDLKLEGSEIIDYKAEVIPITIKEESTEEEREINPLKENKVIINNQAVIEDEEMKKFIENL